MTNDSFGAPMSASDEPEAANRHVGRRTILLSAAGGIGLAGLLGATPADATPSSGSVNLDSEANWRAANAIIAANTVAFETDAGTYKFGDGSTHYKDLPDMSGAWQRAIIHADPTYGDYSKALMDQFAALGEGTVWLPPGTFLINQPLIVPAGISLIGAGGATVNNSCATQFYLQANPRSGGAKPCIKIGDRDDTTAHRAGLFGNFDIDGANVADYGLWLGNVSSLTGIHVTAHRCLKAGFFLDATQNSSFYGFHTDHNGPDQNGTTVPSGLNQQTDGCGLLFDHGASFNRFFGFDTARNWGWSMRFTQSDLSDNYPKTPNSNRIYGADFDQIYAGNGSLLGAPGQIIHEAGDNNMIDGCGIYLQNAVSAVTGIKMIQAPVSNPPGADNSYRSISNHLRVRSAKIQGDTADGVHSYWGTAVHVADNCKMILSASNLFINQHVAFSIEEGGWIVEQDPVEITGPDTYRYGGSTTQSRTVGPVQGMQLASTLPVTGTALTGTGLFATLEPASIYAFEATVFYSVKASLDLKLGLAVPGTASGTWLADGLLSTATASGGAVQRGQGSLSSSAVVGGNDTTPLTVKVTGTVVSTVTGRFELLVAQNTADSANPALILAYSNIVVRKLADVTPH